MTGCWDQEVLGGVYCGVPCVEGIVAHSFREEFEASEMRQSTLAHKDALNSLPGNIEPCGHGMAKSTVRSRV